MPDYEFPRFGDLPFADPIARVIHYSGHDVVLKTIPWRMHYRLMRKLRRARKSVEYGDFGRGDDRF